MIFIFHSVSLETMNKLKLNWKLKNITKQKELHNWENAKQLYNN